MAGRVVARARRAQETATVARLAAGPYLRALATRRHYRVLSEDELRASRRSDTVFVFGSGFSLNELVPDEWAAFAEHDTFAFNWFMKQQWVRVDYHLVREVASNDRDPSVWKPQVADYFGRIRESPHYRETVFLVHSGLHSINGSRAIGLRLLPEGSRVFLWRSVRGRERMGTSFADGLSHPFASLDECVNAAVLMGWRTIVLVGVDLYDRRYFWLGAEETRAEDTHRGATHRDPHSRAATGMIENLGRWGEELRGRGVELSVYNPRSLLAAVLPVHPPVCSHPS